VFRDQAERCDHVVTINAIGDVRLNDEVGEVYAPVSPGASNVRIFTVSANQTPLSVEILPKTIDLMAVGDALKEDKIVVSSNAAVRLIRVSMFSPQESFNLSEVRAIQLTTGFLSGGTLAFRLHDISHSVEYTDATSAKNHYLALKQTISPMAPHIQFSTYWTWWPLLILTPVGVTVCLLLIAKFIKAVQ
jgi:hypothetical protein